MNKKTNIRQEILLRSQKELENGNIKGAESLLKGYLSCFHQDPEISTILAKIYDIQGLYSDALTVLKGQDSNYFCVFEEQVKIYIRLGAYDKVHRLWKNNKDRNFQDLNTRRKLDNARNFLKRTQVFLKSIGKDIAIPDNLTYKEEQYLSFNYKRTLDHIKERHTSKDNKPSASTSSVFLNKYDLEELLLAVSRNIDFSKRELSLNWNYSDTYMFRFRNIGRSVNLQTLNFFRVATIPNSNKIITMFPTYTNHSSTICNLSETDLLPVCNDIVHTDKVYKVESKYH